MLERKHDMSNSQQYWDDNKDDYPYHAVAEIGSPRPEVVKDLGLLHGNFIACPINGKCQWGFNRKTDLDWFLMAHPTAKRMETC